MFTTQNYKTLAKINDTSNALVTIQIATDRSGDVQKFQIKYKNALAEAVQQLTDESLFDSNAMNEVNAHKYLEKASALLDDISFWKNLSDGLIVFVSENVFEVFTVPVKLNDFTYVGNQFYLRHLLPLLGAEKRFFVLALSQNEVRFFEGNKNSITPVRISDLIPNGIDELIGVDDNEQTLQTHSGGGNGAAIYHGHGGGKDDKNIQLEKYFKDVDDGLMKMLHDENAPLVIYSVDYQIPMYKGVSKYSNIMDVQVEGNPENDDPVLIHERVWSKLSSHFTKEKEKSKEKFEQAMVEDKASFAMNTIIPAALNGKVETLFVDSETDVAWGSYNSKNNTISVHPERKANSICMLNEAAMSTFNQSGIVYNIARSEFPRMVSQVNAIYRF